MAKLDEPASGQKSGLKIIHKGLVAIFVPVILQLVCIAWLYVLVDKTGRIAVSEASWARACDLTNDIIINMGKCLSNGALPIPIHGHAQSLESVRSAYLQQSRELKTELFSDQMTAAGPMRQKVADAALECQHHIDALISAMQNIKASSSSLEERLTRLREVRPLLVQTQASVDKFQSVLVELKASLQVAREQQNEAREQMKVQILIAVIIEVITTIMMFLLFVNNIVARLNLLLGNARLIPKEQALARTVNGSDELAYLDEVLCDAAGSLQMAAEHKRLLMEMVAHDLRSPMMSSKLVTQRLIEDSKKIAQELTPRLQELEKQNASVIGFIEDFLTIEKLEAGKLELDWDSVELTQILNDSISQLSALAEAKHITIKREVQPINILGDGRRILQVFNNLISNAIKFSPPDSEILVRFVEEDKQLKVSISDSGPGLPESARANLFDKFYQAHADHGSKGFGLGLAICSLIINEHGGSIGVDSRLGKGSTFWFKLSLDKD